MTARKPSAPVVDESTATAERDRAATTLVAWRDTARTLIEYAEYLNGVELPALVRSLRRMGVRTREVAAMLDVSIQRVGQLNAIGIRMEQGADGVVPPDWWHPPVDGVPALPMPSYHPIVAVERDAPAALPITSAAAA